MSRRKKVKSRSRKSNLQQRKAETNRRQNSKRPGLAYDQLEAKQLLAQLMWDGGGDQTSWDDPLNWDTDSLPQNGDDVVIEGTAETIVFEETLSLNSFSTTTSLTLTDGDLTVTDDVSVSAGNTILADGPFAKFQAANTAAINGASLISQAGGEIVFDNLTAYTHSTGSTENLATFEAIGTNSLIDLRTNYVI